ncbi:hypothetical protein AQ616_17680 [Oceanobacillus sp. E9]|uniref:hypothetical protein n=1 Tax=Oceanobacillus sp. E9 TaxID=1742575 RepID=UPI00084E83ED|nr:hypothetical protein [Oceanobacillus sp. E9]OEH53111.1 hypothetical protein AQ616_17680 [Oceanobacillus sp. E9]
MNKSIFGSFLLLISALLYATRYLCSAIMMVNSGEWGEEVFSLYLSFIPNGLMVATVASLIIGIVFIVWEFIEKGKVNISG